MKTSTIPASGAVALALLALVATTAAAATTDPAAAVTATTTPTTGMKFVSTPGDWVGRGLTLELDPPGHDFSGTVNGNHASIAVSDTPAGWVLDLASHIDTPLAKGSYPGAVRWPFQSPMRNGMSFTGRGAACNTSIGWYRIRELGADAKGNIRRLAVDFEQNCDGGPPLYGAIRIASKFPLTVPVIAAVPGDDFAAISGETATLDSAQSFTRHKGALARRWTQTAGPVATLSDPTAVAPTFVVPDVPPEGATLRFQLQVTDAAGSTDTDDVVVVVNSASTPRTRITVHGDPGDYITLGQSYEFDPWNSVLTFSKNFDGGISVNVQSPWLPWYFDTAEPAGAPFKAGSFPGAWRYPFQSATQPGLDVSGEGRGCNQLLGSFKVFSAKFDATTGQPTKTDITFVQHCEGVTAAAYGEILLNDVPHALVAQQLKAARARYPKR